VSTRWKPLTIDEIRQAMDSMDPPFPPIVSPKLLASLLGVSRKTIYEWISQGRLDGAFRKCGKHNLIWRDRAIELIFNGKREKK
jgi:excisionase family DNA binding protein